ncbi:MAG: transglycosylase domain-containing protein [Synechococcaceae cyanobacterium]
MRDASEGSPQAVEERQASGADPATAQAAGTTESRATGSEASPIEASPFEATDFGSRRGEEWLGWGRGGEGWSATGLVQSRPLRRLRLGWRRASRRQARLELWQGENLLKTLRLEQGHLLQGRLGGGLQADGRGDERYRIGRDPACELVVEAASNISRVHAFVEKDRPEDRDWRLQDFDSANGLFWRDRRIRAIELRHGDLIQLGSPLREAPTLRYLHPSSPLERLSRGVGMMALLGSGVVISALLALSSISGGSRVDFIGGPVKIVSPLGQRIDSKEGAATAMARLEDYPLVLRQALLASEDAHFGWNSGLDIGGTVRSLIRRTGGGSGITQQVARMVYPWVKNGNPNSPWPWVRIAEFDGAGRPNRWGVFARKLRELPVSWQLETRFNKNEILKMYLDRAYLGLGAEGFEQGAQLYFRKSARQLDASEAAYLVGLLPSPNGYNICAPTPGQLRAERLERERRGGQPEKPLEDEQTWTPKLRRDLVLRRMLEEGYLSQEQYRNAIRQPLIYDAAACRQSRYRSYPFFSDYALWELEGSRFSLNIDPNREGGNYHVVATIDTGLQAKAQQLLLRFLETRARPLGITQGALISLDVRSGRILAYVGGGDYRFDRVQSMRQPGSTFKLFTYLAALERGIPSSEVISCAPIYQLQEGCRHGTSGGMTMADGLAYSENPIALHLAERVGFEKVIAMARRLGISADTLQPDPNMVLGGNEVLLYEMARAFAVVANGGRTVPMHGVERIYDLGVCRSETVLGQCPASGIFRPLPEKPQQLLDPGVAAAMDAMLQQAVAIGTGRPAAVIADARGKTGTTNNGVDAWFIGYSPQRGVLTGIWFGNDDNRPAEAAAGALAAELWGQVMRQV